MERSHFYSLMSVLQECLLCHRWQQARSILASLCLYPSPDARCKGKDMPGGQLIWKCGIEMMYNLPDATYTDVAHFHSKRCQLDQRASSFQSLLEHAFYLLHEQRLKEAYTVVTKKVRFEKQRGLFTNHSKQARYEKVTYHKIWKKMVTAYIGFIEYVLWYQADLDDESVASQKKADKFWESAVSHLGTITDQRGVFDIFITKHVELLCSKDKMDDAIKLVTKYAETNPENPNSQKYLYHLLVRREADKLDLTDVLKGVVDRLPSDELVLKYVQLKCQESKHSYKQYLPHLFNMLDYACWKDGIQPWQELAAKLEYIHKKRSENGMKVIRSCWQTRQNWWGKYHFDPKQALQMAKQDRGLVVEKTVVAVFLLNPECAFVKKIVKQFKANKKRKCLKRINRAQTVHYI